MADSKLSALAALTAANVDPTSDLLYIDDVSVTTSKSITVAALSQAMIVLGTEQASTSGTSIDFTGIPSGTKRIVINFSGVSTSGTSKVIVQLGDAGGPETTGYLGGITQSAGSAVSNFTFSDGFMTDGVVSASNVAHGSIILNLERASTFMWTAHIAMAPSNAAGSSFGAGSKATSAELTQVRITTQNGSDTFDAGVINISYT